MLGVGGAAFILVFWSGDLLNQHSHPARPERVGGAAVAEAGGGAVVSDPERDGAGGLGAHANGDFCGDPRVCLFDESVGPPGKVNGPVFLAVANIRPRVYAASLVVDFDGREHGNRWGRRPREYGPAAWVPRDQPASDGERRPFRQKVLGLDRNHRALKLSGLRPALAHISQHARVGWRQQDRDCGDELRGERVDLVRHRARFVFPTVVY